MNVAFLLLDAGVGGGQRVAASVAELLIARGDSVGLLVPGPGPAVERFRSFGAEVRYVDLVTLRRPYGMARAVRIVRGYDLLYSHTSIPGQILASVAARLACCSHVAHQHTYPGFSSRPLISKAQSLLYRVLLSRTRFIAVAKHVQQGLIARGMPPEHVDVIANGVSIPEEMDADAGQPHSLRVGMLGRFDPGKGMHTFIAAARSAQRGRPMTYVIGGHPGPFRDHENRIREEARGAGVEIVDATESGLDFLRSLDVVIVPSRYEGSPLVLLEAMALGKAIIAADISGIREIIEHDDSGLLFPPDDADSLEDAILTLSADPVARARLGKGARYRVVKQYPLARSLDRIVYTLEKAVNGDG